MDLPKPAEYDVTKHPTGYWDGIGKVVDMVVHPGISVHRMFKRRSVKKGAVNGETCWLVGEVDGVRCYVREENGRVSILMTREDLYP